MWRSGQDRKNCLRKCHRLALVECGKNRRCKPARKNRHHRANRPADGLLWSGFGTACIHLHSRTRVSAWTYTSGGSWRIRFTFPPAKCFYSRARAARETWKNSGNASPEIIFLRGRLWSKFYNAPEERIEDGCWGLVAIFILCSIMIQSLQYVICRNSGEMRTDPFLCLRVSIFSINVSLFWI